MINDSKPNSTPAIDWTNVQQTKPDTRPPRSTPATVLIEVHADGFIQVYGDKHIQVKIVNRPIATSAPMGIRVDEMLDEALPYRYREIYYPGNVIKTGMVKPIKISDVHRIDAKLELLNGIGEPSRYFRNPKSRILAALEA